MTPRDRLRDAETAWLRRFSANERRHPLRLLMLVATRLADGWGLAIIIPLALLIGGRTRGVAAVAMGTVSAVTLAILVQSVKALVRRRRPAGLVLEKPITAPDKHAFPSGHTAQSFGIVLLAWTVSPWLGGVALAIAILVGLSRLFFGLHYPTDVVVGALLGVAWSWMVIWLSRETGWLDWLLSVASSRS